jgi:hypothetical protein
MRSPVPLTTARISACRASPSSSEFRALQAAFAHRGILGPPIEGHGAPPHDQRDDQQGQVPCASPVNGQLDGTMSRGLNEGLQEDRLSQVPRLQALIVEQARQPLGGCFLIAKAPGPLG